LTESVERRKNQQKDQLVQCITSKCPRRLDLFPNCLIQVESLKDFLLTKENRCSGLIRFISHEKINTDIMDFIINKLSDDVEYELSDEIRDNYGVTITKQLVICYICVRTIFEYYKKELSFADAKKVYEAFSRYYVLQQDSDYIKSKIFLSTEIRIEKEFSDLDIIVQNIVENTSSELGEIKDYINYINGTEVGSEEQEIQIENKQLEKPKEENVKKTKRKNSYSKQFVKIDETILEIDIEKATTDQLQDLLSFLSRYAKCHYCKNRNNCDYILDCPKITEKALAIIKEKTIRSNWDNRKIRYCLAKEYKQLVEKKLESLQMKL